MTALEILVGLRPDIEKAVASQPRAKQLEIMSTYNSVIATLEATEKTEQLPELQLAYLTGKVEAYELLHNLKMPVQNYGM